MTVVYYKINYLPVRVRIWFQVNFGGRVFRVKVLLYKLTFLQFVMLAGVICQPAVCRIGQYLLLYIFFKTKDVSVIRYLCGFLHLAELPFFPYCNGILTSPHKMFCVLSPIASVCSIKILMHKALHSISQWKLVNDSVTIPFLL